MKRFGLISFVILLGVVAIAPAQIPYIGGTGYSQDFNSLANDPSGNPYGWTNNVTLLGWYAADNGGAVTSYYADDGSSTKGGLYSYGPNLNTDRALGTLASNDVGEMYLGVRFDNASPGWTLTSFSFRFYVEQWRDGSEDSWVNYLGFAINPSGGLTDPGFLEPATVVNVVNSNAGAVDGNTYRYLVTGTVTGITWAPGDELWLRWRDPNDPGSDHGLAIDDFSFSAVPEPTTLALVGIGMGAAGLATRRLRRKKIVEATV